MSKFLTERPTAFGSFLGRECRNLIGAYMHHVAYSLAQDAQEEALAWKVLELGRTAS